jgi:archaellin
LAAGGTLASYLFFNTTCIGEIHQMLGASPARSGGYSPINLKGSLRKAEPKYVTVESDWSLSEDISKDDNMGGFTIRVLPAGTEAKGPALDYNNTIFNDATDVNSPRRGEAPFIICVPYSYTLANVPQEGKKTTTVWGWPGEGIHITDAYTEFEKWVDDVENNKNWYAYPNKQYIVSTAGLAGSQPVDMTEDEIEYVKDPNNQELNISEENTINGGDTETDEGDDVNDGETTMTVQNSNNYFFDIVYNESDGTYNILYGSKEIKSHVTSVTMQWSGYDANGGNLHICSPWRTFDYASGNANGQAIVTKANLEELMTQEKKLLVTCDNNPLTLTIK